MVLLILLGNVLLETLLWRGACILLVSTRAAVTIILPSRNTSLNTDWEMLGDPQVFLEKVCSKQLINLKVTGVRPYNVSRLLILSGCVDYRHYRYWRHIADVIIDQELEVGDVDQREVPGVEVRVRMRSRDHLV